MVAATTEILDLPAAFTEVGGVTPIDDQHNALAAYLFDGVNDAGTSALEPFTASSGSKHSLTCWIKDDGSVSLAKIITNMRTMSTSTDAVFSLIIDASQLLEINFMSNGVTDRVKCSTADISAILLDDEWHHIAVTVNGDVCVIYIDAIDRTNATLISGGGFTGVKSGSLTPLTVGNDINNAHPMDGIVSRLKFWEGTTLTLGQVEDELAAEQALLEDGGGILSPILPRGLGPVIPRMI